MTPHPHAPAARPTASSPLPAELTSFVGRERELADILHLLDSARLVTLTGAAGCGKTRLALRAAAEAGSRFADGLCWVELAHLDDPLLVAQTVAKTLGVAESPASPLTDTLVEALRSRHLLLVLDNCEHLLDACAALVKPLLALPGMRILATSREPLQVTGEMRYPVSPLVLPAPSLPVNGLEQVEAIRLFLERARAILPSFDLTLHNGPIIAGICQRLDGMPLAIELVSAHVNVMTVEEIAARLDDRPALLGGASPATRSPHRTMRAALGWSYDLLTAPEQAALRRLSVFSGGWSLAAAEAVCAGDDIKPAQVLSLLASLVNKSLVVADTLQGRETRYRLLEIIRQYAQEKLTESGEWQAAHDDLLDITVTWVEAAAPKLVGPHQQQWLDRMDAETGNLRVALDWALEQNHMEAGARLTVALYQFWDRRGNWREGLAWFERLNERLHPSIALGVHVQALAYGSFLAMSLHQQAVALRWSQAALALWEAARDSGAAFLSLVLSARASAARTAGDAATTYTLSGRILDLNRTSPDPLMFGMQVYIHGFLGIVLGYYEAARADLEEALLRAQWDDEFRIALTLTALGDLARCERQHVQALALYEQSLPRFRRLGANREIPLTERAQAFACLCAGDVSRAYILFLHSLDELIRQDDWPGVLHGLLGCSALAAVLGQPAVCARLNGFVARESEDHAPWVDATYAADRLDADACIKRARAALGEAEFATEQMIGRALSLAQAVDLAQRLPQPVATSPADVGLPSADLTPREREVAALIGRGLSNSEIADELVLSKRTVEKHIANILGKLGFTQRTQIVRWALEHGSANTEP